MKRQIRIIAAVALAGMCSTLLPQDVEAIPRYTARYRQGCTLCHFDPAGGGQRSTYATQYLIPKEMTAVQWTDEQLERIQPLLGENVVVGADMRTLATYSADEEARAENNFFQMQSDLYVSLQADDRFALYLDRGQSSTLEAFGMAYLLPHNGYIKVGRFTPAFGWEFADHNTFVREQAGFIPPSHTDVGFELGMSPGNGEAQVSLRNGNNGGVLDTNDELAFTARAAYRFDLAGVGISIGGSYLADDERLGLEGASHHRKTGGPFGALHWKRWTWLGEADWSSGNGGSEDGSDVISLTTSQELAFQLRRGVDIVGRHSLHDPDVDLTSGAKQRWAIGLDLFWNPFAILSVLHQAYVVDEGDAVFGSDYGQTVLQAHFLY